MQEITLSATIESIAHATEFVNTIISENGCPMDTEIQIDIAIDELFGNIANYAYPSGGGTVTVQVEVMQNPARAAITFIDSGTPYNPLEHLDPDITKPVEERGIGGLGIFVVKKSMDDICYRYIDKQNMLTITKRFSTSRST